MNRLLSPGELKSNILQSNQPSVPIIEGLDTNEEKITVYKNTSNIVPGNISYLNCASNNEKQCASIKDALHEQQLLLNNLLDVRNQSKMNYEACDTRLKSCELLYNDINDKTVEFKNIWNEIGKIKQQLKSCASDKKTCDQQELKIKKLEKSISKQQGSLDTIKKKFRSNKC